MVDAMTHHTAGRSISVVYVQAEVRCRGKHHGELCDRILAKRLTGVVELKCPRCKAVHTYRRKGIDTGSV